ncbi:MAG TPA: hypothetical protein VNP73_10000, partial [Actinomycetota bacterium]|nr:hypothetical protein [Actinomycetota bacterium]
LAYLRTRHSFGTGDLARTTNHGTYLISLLRKLRQEVKTNPAALLSWIQLTKRHTSFGMTSGEMFRLGVLASQIKPGKVRNITVPASTGSVGAASVVFISGNARSIYQRFRAKGSL